jgi:hypothetical protein
MANSGIVGKSKYKIIKELIKNPDIINAIGSNISASTPEQYINKHIFNYHQNPFTIKEVMTYITIQIHIPRIEDKNKTFAKPTVEIWVISNERHMNVDNVPKITMNRNDYLAELIDRQLNNRSGFGLGKLMLVSNVEGALQNDYLYRRLIFECTDLNPSLCEVED